MKTIVWKPRGSMNHHSTVKQFEYAQEQTRKDPPKAAFDELKPAQSMRVVHDDSVSIDDTDNDRITFSNGVTVHEESYESGLNENGALTVTHPDGKKVVLNNNYAWIDSDDEAEEFQPAIYFKMEDQFGYLQVWKQSFPAEGGSEITAPQGEEGMGFPDFHFAPSGGLRADMNGFYGEKTAVEARREGDALVAKDGAFEFGVNPPIPVDWLTVK